MLCSAHRPSTALTSRRVPAQHQPLVLSAKQRARIERQTAAVHTAVLPRPTRQLLGERAAVEVPWLSYFDATTAFALGPAHAPPLTTATPGDRRSPRGHLDGRAKAAGRGTPSGAPERLEERLLYVDQAERNHRFAEPIAAPTLISLPSSDTSCSLRW